MRFVTIKRASEIKLEGITARLDVVNNIQKGILLSDSKGNVLRVRISNYSDISIEVQAPPEVEKKHKVTGTVLELPVEKTFDDRYEADRELSRLEGAAPGNTDLKVEEVEVPIDGQGSTDDIPF